MSCCFWLVEKRKIMKLSREELARKADISTVYLTKLERGERDHPSVEVAKKIASEINATITEQNLHCQKINWTSFFPETSKESEA
jgi:transcriptional regulator with XRE-family HTH domain